MIQLFRVRLVFRLLALGYTISCIFIKNESERVCQAQEKGGPKYNLKNIWSIHDSMGIVNLWMILDKRKYLDIKMLRKLKSSGKFHCHYLIMFSAHFTCYQNFLLPSWLSLVLGTPLRSNICANCIKGTSQFHDIFATSLGCEIAICCDIVSIICFH